MQKEWLPFVVFLGGIFSLVALLKLWGHRCPKCETRMKRVSKESLGLQPPQIINWVDTCGIPPDDITVARTNTPVALRLPLLKTDGRGFLFAIPPVGRTTPSRNDVARLVQRKIPLCFPV